MDLPSFTDLDDDLFPFCTAGTVGALHTDEYRVLWVCDLSRGSGSSGSPSARTPAGTRDPGDPGGAGAPAGRQPWSAGTPGPHPSRLLRLGSGDDGHRTPTPADRRA